MKKLLILLPLIFCCLALTAQTNAKDDKQVKLSKYHTLLLESVSVGMQLSEAKLESFKNIYKEYCVSTYAIRAKEPKLSTPNLTNEQIEKTILESYRVSKQGISLKEEYYHKFRTILSSKQISKMYNLEKAFREKFAREQRERNKKKAE